LILENNIGRKSLNFGCYASEFADYQSCHNQPYVFLSLRYCAFVIFTAG